MLLPSLHFGKPSRAKLFDQRAEPSVSNFRNEPKTSLKFRGEIGIHPKFHLFYQFFWLMLVNFEKIWVHFCPKFNTFCVFLWLNLEKARFLDFFKKKLEKLCEPSFLIKSSSRKPNFPSRA